MINKLRSTDKKGFTLIELMIVIAIIGILAAIAIPNFIAYRDKAYCSYAENDGSNIKAAIACYFAEPENTTLQEFASLTNDVTCNVTLNENNTGLSAGQRQRLLLARAFYKEFDILIDLTLEDVFVLQYVTGLSRSKLKVGRYSKIHENYFDLMISLKGSTTMEEYIDHVLHYLLILKQK